jgi:hypothetical protein
VSDRPAICRPSEFPAIPNPRSDTTGAVEPPASCAAWPRSWAHPPNGRAAGPRSPNGVAARSFVRSRQAIQISHAGSTIRRHAAVSADDHPRRRAEPPGHEPPSCTLRESDSSSGYSPKRTNFPIDRAGAALLYRDVFHVAAVWRPDGGDCGCAEAAHGSTTLHD